jgi:RNA polymerase sigma-70 factor (ECF subfamily)
VDAEARSDGTEGVARDAALVLRAAAGDVDAVAELYDRHAARVLAVVRRILRSASEAEDVVHDVFIEAWLAARSYDPARASVGTWLLVRARSRALDRRGRNVREEALRHSFPAPSEVDEASSGESRTARQLEIEEALARLDDNVRETLTLTYVAGLTAAEVGARMAVPAGTVKSRLARGLAQLHHFFTEVGGGEGP